MAQQDTEKMHLCVHALNALCAVWGYFVMGVFFMFCLIVVPQPPGKTPFAVKLNNKKINNNSMALVQKRTIPTEQPLIVTEVSGNFCR
jgi:hypothetical protein